MVDGPSTVVPTRRRRVGYVPTGRSAVHPSERRREHRRRCGESLLADTSIRAAIALLLPTRVFLALGPVTGWVIIGCLLWYSHATIRSWEAEGTGSITCQPILDGPVELDDHAPNWGAGWERLLLSGP